MKRLAKEFATENNARKAEVQIIWDNTPDDKDDFVEISENENLFTSQKKNKKDFNDLSDVVEEEDDYSSIDYEIDKEKIKNKGDTAENPVMIIND